MMDTPGKLALLGSLNSSVSNALSPSGSSTPVVRIPLKSWRLPSQQVHAAQQDLIEGSAIASLAKVGLVIDPAKARLAVTITANTQVAARYTGYGYGSPNMPFGLPVESLHVPQLAGLRSVLASQLLLL